MTEKFTQEEREIAKNIIDNKPLLALLIKVLVEPQQQWTSEVIAMNNQNLGELVKADVLAGEKIKQRFDVLKRMVAGDSKPSSPTAPK